MRSISTNGLSNMTRQQLFGLLVQFQAVLADLTEGSTEYQFCLATLQNIRAVLARRAPAP